MKTKVLSVFPACGKTWMFKCQDTYHLTILDSDSSKFSWIDVDGKKERNPDFPANYIKHIKENIGKYDYIFVSSHKAVRDALDKEGIDYIIVYPSYQNREEWVGRCYIRQLRGEDGCKPDVLYNNWSEWVTDCMEAGQTHEQIVLYPTEYLGEVFWFDDITDWGKNRTWVERRLMEMRLARLEEEDNGR